MGLIVLLAVLQYRLWFGNANLFEVTYLKNRKNAQIVENKELQERNRSLSAEVMNLKHGLEAIEERARSEMGMVKVDETFYQIVESKDKTSLGQTENKK